mgnify:CR=1 FL=1
MILKLVKEMKGSEFVQKMEEKYGSMDKLERLIKNDPENYLYTLDLDDWIFHLEHSDAPIKQTEVLFVDKFKIDISDLELLDVIKKEHPKSIRNLSNIVNKDIKTVQPKIRKLTESGLIKLEHGPKNAKKPVVNYDKIEIEI